MVPRLGAQHLWVSIDALFSGFCHCCLWGALCGVTGRAKGLSVVNGPLLVGGVGGYIYYGGHGGTRRLLTLCLFRTHPPMLPPQRSWPPVAEPPGAAEGAIAEGLGLQATFIENKVVRRPALRNMGRSWRDDEGATFNKYASHDMYVWLGVVLQVCTGIHNRLF